MKNSKNKIIAAVICGVVLGSVGTSIVGNFQSKTEEVSKYVSNENSEKANSKVTDDGSSENSSNNKTPCINEDHTQNNSAQCINEGNQEGEKRGPGGGKGGHHHGAASLDSTESVDLSIGSYCDGVYTGTADGYAKNLSVQVEISNGNISDIQITSHNETPGFYEKAFETVPAEIIEKQTTAVDTASGATYSSVGIINAVNNALNDAKA